jgi:hypothetical protein
MVDRMGEDMVFSHEDARKDFNYNPNAFSTMMRCLFGFDLESLLSWWEPVK